MRNTQIITIDQFITKHQLEMHTVRVKKNPNMAEPLPRNFECTIEQRGFGNHKELVTYFSQGEAHKKSPTLAEVLDCLASDAAGVENAKDFEDFANEYGYDTDSRKAESVYDTCVKLAQDLKEFLGPDLYTELLWNTERE